ncbi:hypothetical protein R3P38DRAFT_2493523 [Favolaschia claudopus]|uniref:Uncharacterized protein n=1 Tax=Favolaschia claudopus TaxID=2862362 RepID=A0AAW0EC87_9AGAR
MTYPRPSNNTHAPPVSYIPPASETPSSPSSPRSTSPRSPSTSRGRRPSISNPMHWLSRASTQSSVTLAKPTARISEPKLIHSPTEVSSLRAGVLGSGATIVRTPDEALRDTRVRLTYDGAGESRESVEATDPSDERPEEEQEIEYSPPTSTRSSSASEEDEIPSPPDSPPLPALPADEKAAFSFDNMISPSFKFPLHPPTRAVPITPTLSTPTLSLRPSLKTKRTESVDAPVVIPPLPASVSSIPVPPVFNPILLSEAPSSTADRSKIVVSLETCTTTYKTTLDTLSSRPSHLSDYIATLLGRRRSDSVASSVYSTDSADLSTYRQHLVSRGLLPQASSSVHIFLDRPSEPYVHILTYLRSPRVSEGPEVLPPRAARAGLDSLLELRDEAAYLGLEDLHKLCVEQIRQQQQRPRLRTAREHSSAGSIHSLHASVSSLQTMLERVERHHSRSMSKESVAEMGKPSPPTRSPPTPESWVSKKITSSLRQGSIRSPPAGWI